MGFHSHSVTARVKPKALEQHADIEVLKLSNSGLHVEPDPGEWLDVPPLQVAVYDILQLASPLPRHDSSATIVFPLMTKLPSHLPLIVL